MGRILVLILLFPTLLSAQTRRFCRADGTFVDISEGFTPREAAGLLLDYYNYSGPSYASYPPNPKQAVSLQDGLRFLGFANLASFQEKFALAGTGLLDYSTLGVLINKLKDSQELFGGNANCPQPPRVESPLPVPAIARLDFAGPGWHCRMGFIPVDNDCTPVRVPEHASLNFSGDGWTCRRGYIKDKDSCVPVAVPLNASLNLSGTGWVCHRGFIPDGRACAPVSIPENATLNLSGNGWICRLGFHRVEDGCLKSPGFVMAKLQ